MTGWTAGNEGNPDEAAKNKKRSAAIPRLIPFRFTNNRPVQDRRGCIDTAHVIPIMVARLHRANHAPAPA